MESLNREQVKTLIGRFYMQNYQAGKVFTFKHFLAMEIQKSLIYRAIHRFEEGSDAKHKSWAWPPTQKLPPKQARRLVAVSSALWSRFPVFVQQLFFSRFLADFDAQYG